MVPFVVTLILATVLGSAWCAAEGVVGRWAANRSALLVGAVALAAAVGLAVGLRFFLVPPHHAMYLDEPWYAEAACNLATRGELVLCEETWIGAACLPYEKAIGWPVLLSAWTKLVGCHTTVGIDINRVVGVLTVVLVAAATLSLGGRWWQSAFAATLAAAHPVHVAWSATGETNVAAAAALIAGLCGALIFVERGRWCGAALAVSGLALSTAIRPESAIPALVASAVVALAARAGALQRLSVTAAIGVVSAASAIAGMRLWAMNESISGGAFLSVGNVLRHGSLLAQGEALQVRGIVALLAIGGALACVRTPRRGGALLLLGAGLTAALVALAYDRFHERMLLGATVAFLPLTPFAFDWLPARFARGLGAGAVVAVLTVLWRDALVSASHPPETQLLETRIAASVGRLALDLDALFIAEQPTVLAAAGIARVMSTQRALADEAKLGQALSDGRAVYFLCDMNCETGFQGGVTPPLCGQVLERFSLLPVAEESLHSRAYVLYRVAAPGGDDHPVPTCPRASPAAVE